MGTPRGGRKAIGHIGLRILHAAIPVYASYSQRKYIIRNTLHHNFLIPHRRQPGEANCQGWQGWQGVPHYPPTVLALADGQAPLDLPGWGRRIATLRARPRTKMQTAVFRA